MFQNLSFRFRLVLLISIVLVPALTFIILGIYSTYNNAQKEAVSSLKQFARTFSVEQSQTMEGARQLLVALAETPEINGLNPVVCSTHLFRLLKNYSRYANFGVVDNQGNLICTGVKSDQKVNVQERLFFQRVKNTRQFSIGEYQIGSVTKKSVLNFGYPILNTKGGLKAVVFSSLDLSWVNQFVASIETDPDTVLMVLDQNGTVMARSPESEKWIGDPFISDTVLDLVLNSGDGTQENSGLDGIKRLYVFQKLDEADAGYVVVGKTQDRIFADAENNLLNSLLVVGVMGIFVAVASWKVGDLFLVKRLEDLQEMDKLKSEFVSIASHQLRTPLSAINWSIELIKEDKKMSIQTKKLIKNISESNGRMIDLVESLLNISRIESNTLRIEIQRVDVGKIVRDVLKETNNRFKSKKQHLRLTIKKKLITKLDPKLLYQVVSNIVSNANKYTPTGGKIEVSAYGNRNRLVIRVKDNGYGILKKDRSKLFQKFFRGENIAEYDIDGSGLGLFIAKSITEKMSGQISFKSTPMKGTTFYISFPRLM